MLQEAKKRETQVGFGRCKVTGEFASCVLIDPGDVSFDTFDKDGKPVTYELEVQISISKDGLLSLLSNAPVTLDFPEIHADTFDAEGTPNISAIQVPDLVLDKARIEELLTHELLDIQLPSPELAYGWQIYTSDDRVISQFPTDAVENPWPLDERVVAFMLIPRFDTDLPVYSFDMTDGTFYKNAESIDFCVPLSKEAKFTYFRKITISFGSVSEGLTRNLHSTGNNVLQCFGWCAADDPRQATNTTYNDDPAPAGAVIAIDGMGEWRPYYEAL